MGVREQSPIASIPPRYVGRYEIVRPIARGGMAEVYLARTRPVAGVERLFAIKFCHPHLRDDHEFASMFIEEARLAAQIRHPNVVATFDVGDGDLLYLVMEYVEGQPLSELIKAMRRRGERLPLPITLRILADALAGLHAAHEARGADGSPLGIVHRDVSPQNILVGLDGVARIVDFGIAKAEASATVTREGQVKGKLAYLPPEQLTEHVMTRRGDVYAMGVVLWESLTCQRLFQGQNAGDIAIKILEKTLDPPSVFAAEVPPALDDAVMKALRRDPSQRFTTAADLAAALEGCGIALASHRAVGALVTGVQPESGAGAARIARGAETSGSIVRFSRSAVVPSDSAPPAAALSAGSARIGATAAAVDARSPSSQPPPVLDSGAGPPARPATAGRVRGAAGALLLMVGAVALAHRTGWLFSKSSLSSRPPSGAAVGSAPSIPERSSPPARPVLSGTPGSPPVASPAAPSEGPVGLQARALAGSSAAPSTGDGVSAGQPPPTTAHRRWALKRAHAGKTSPSRSSALAPRQKRDLEAPAVPAQGPAPSAAPTPARPALPSEYRPGGV